ncbi:MAG: VCBS repeat-containing protein, partial [Bacteroidota bacterium]
LFDADQDADLDLYVVSGGNDRLKPSTYYQDRLYIQTSEGFVKSKEALPEILASGSTVIPADYDKDGDLDLFVGGRIIPGQYPYPAQSYLLRNEGGKDGELRYKNVSDELLVQLKGLGLVTSALWDDFDEDGNIDLVICGEWMSPRFFRYTGKGFEDFSPQTGLGKHIGWWYSLQKADIDGDGDMDYIAGNLGLNYKYKASVEKPFEIYVNDFDENGKEDIVLSYETSGKKVPLRGRECSSQQVPAIKMRFQTFELFADASLADIYGQSMLDESLHYAATTFAHAWFENKGAGKFELHQLPTGAQFSAINAIEVFDYNQDQIPDILLAGNLYQAEVETPRADAGTGLVMTGSSPHEFELLSAGETALFLEGEVKDIQTIRLANGRKGFLIARNDLPLQLLGLEP